MLLTFVLLICLSASIAKPVQESSAQEDLSLNNFEFSYKNDDSERQEEGNFDNGRFVVKGRYKFVTPNGETYEVEYLADENGFHPKFTSGKKIETPMVVYASPILIKTLVG